MRKRHIYYSIRWLTIQKSLELFQLKSLTGKYLSDVVDMAEIITAETSKSLSRTEIINYCINKRRANRYLEIGVRNPAHNFDLINCPNKVSVDPGIEFEPNPVDFPMTSDDFFLHWRNGIRTSFDVIFIDGLHRAEQVSRDIKYALEMVTDEGLVILHDCNPPHYELVREHHDRDSAAKGYWNGTTWKAAWEFFFNGSRELRVVDSDWGVGIIDNSKRKTPQVMRNPFFEFDEFASLKRDVGYLVSWEAAKEWLE